MDLYAEILASTIRMSVPLVLAALAGLWSERSGIVDIGLEGKMLAAAFVAVPIPFGTLAVNVLGSLAIGLLMGGDLHHPLLAGNLRMQDLARHCGFSVQVGSDPGTVDLRLVLHEKALAG